MTLSCTTLTCYKLVDVVGSIDVDCGSKLYSDLVKAQQSLVVANHLHLLFLSTPYDLVAEIKPNWMIYLHEASNCPWFHVHDDILASSLIMFCVYWSFSNTD